jgi:MFS family permease
VPVLSVEPESFENDQWHIGASPESQTALHSHFSIDSSAYQIDTDNPHLDDPFAQQHRSAQPWRSAQGFGSRPDDSFRTADFAVVPTRPPLRPTVSFGNKSTYSYYSSANDDLEQKSQALAVEEEAQRNASHLRLYACVAILCCLNFLCGMNISSLATSLPTLAYDLDLPAVQSFWLINTYLLSATIIQPLSMRLSAAIGSKPLLSSGLLLWAGGSITSALAKTIVGLLVGRAVTGVGAGVVGILIPLVLPQLQPQGHTNSERSVSLSFWLGAFAGAIVGGALAQPSTWRYIFYLNLPICLLALVGLPWLLRLSSTQGVSWRSLLRLDYIGWLLLSGSITSFSLTASWAGTSYSWTSLQTLVPLITSAVCFVCWIIRSLYAQDSILPVSIFRKPPGVVSCLGIMVHGIIFVGLVYFTPFLHLGGHLNPMVLALTLSPYTLALAILSLSGGIAIASFHRWSAWVGWAIVATSVGLLMLAKETDVRSVGVPISLIVGMALGILAGSLSATIQSTPSNDDETIYAAPLSVFFSTLGNTLGLTISSCVFLNRLRHEMQSTESLLGNAEMFTRDAVRMALVTQNLPADQPGLKANLIVAYINALHWVWIVLAMLAGIAFLSNTYMLVATRMQWPNPHNDKEKQDSCTY